MAHFLDPSELLAWNPPNRWDLGQMGMGFNIVRVIGLKRAERRPPPIPTAGE